jgi:phosphatidylinositol phospholipase C delta
MLKIEDEKYTKDKLAAWACIRLDRVQQGYRLVKLLDAKGVATHGLLLVKIEKTVVAGDCEDRPLLSRIGAWKIE